MLSSRLSLTRADVRRIHDAATTDFDDFMKFEPCATGTHSSEKPEPVAQPVEAAPASSQAPSSKSGATETYGSATPAPPLPPAPTANTAPPKPVSTAYVEEQDDPDVKVEKGMTCKRKSCGKSHEGEGMSRDDEECRYHPGVPIFHEGSKGFSCCKRRVLEFDEFREFALPRRSTPIPPCTRLTSTRSTIGSPNRRL